MTPDELDTVRAFDIIHIGPGSGVACKHMYARFIRRNTWTSWPGMAWLEVHELERGGDGRWRPIEDARMAYVAIAGIRLVQRINTLRPERNRPTNAGPARIPRPRTSPETTGRTR